MNAPDPRLGRALALLQECLRGASSDRSQPAWSAEDDWLQSSTDVLTPWFPDRWSGTPAAGGVPSAHWDAYFDAGPGADHESAPPFVESAAEPPLDPAIVEAVVETLYAFLHAIGRADVEAALAEVADDYHAMEGDREVARDGLRQQIESLIDTHRVSGFEISLAQVPQPVPHPLGMLVKLTIQIDSRRDDATPSTVLLHRVAVFRDTPDGRWFLASLGLVPASA
jgi:ketosteroid isomerase-like protein